MVKIYGTAMCPDCEACRANFDANGVEYDFRDISTSLKELAVFIKIRDLNEVFAPIKGSGSIGIPAIVKEDRTVRLDWENYLRELGYEVIANKNSCTIDGKGC